MIWVSTPWFSGSGNTCTYEEILDSILKNKIDHEIHVGCDSQSSKDGTVFAVAICLYLPKAGAIYFVTRKNVTAKKYKHMGVRLQHESELAISLASDIRDIIGIDSITVHADVSPNPINKSFKYSTGIQSFIKSMGFKCLIKPDSWAAWVADKHAR
jgi:predicted RNase H-related nuclease YkuK (DUF458 family)